MNEGLDFVCAESSGVPILLCPAELANHWEGINEPTGGREINAVFHLNGPDGAHVDYDRACDAAAEYISSIQIGTGQALVFGDEIPAMYWIKSETFNGGYALTWLFLPDAEHPDYRKLIKALPDGFFSDSGYTVTCSDKGFLLFPSTQSPIDGDYFESVEIKVPAGTYATGLGFYETSETNIRIIRIQQQNK
ncbi:hypothetical protein JAO73_17490 [Hymenobacter sp. BT523]|uniref:hypothetical protein n=1 Tax=Hymenobacter sp. BT523 TaxID=2795725 RepID=UPI0018EBDCA1|nr:hypothetical protein [Hymenobacter sp. BT523]MBJ6110820.1 hypothetical protein [Hymenobacter sp. BT523]